MAVTTYNQFVTDMMNLRLLYDKSKGDAAKRNKISADIKNLRHTALMSNIDLYSLERDAYFKQHSKEPDATWQTSANLYIQEAMLLKQLLDIRKRHEVAPPAEKAPLHAEAMQIRMRIVALGLDAYQLEERAFILYRGKAMNDAERKTHYGFVDEATKKYANMNAEKMKDFATVQVGSWEKKRPTVSKLDLGNRYNETYSGADMVIFMAFPGYKPIEIGVASTVSYSTYREKKQIRTIGRVSAKGITKGPRTISGRIIFTVIREHVIEMIKKEIPYLRDIKTMLMDELPAFDLLVSFGSEYGGSAGLVIQGITTVDEQKTLSIEDLFTENIFTYLARGLEPMRDLFATSAGTPYDPLTWFTSSFRAAGSEVLGNFKPKELQLYSDSKLLAAPLPFYGSVAGWDSSSYNMNMYIPLLDPGTGIEMGGSEGGGTDGKAGSIFVQILVDSGGTFWPYSGFVQLYADGTFMTELDTTMIPIAEVPHTTYDVSVQKFPARETGNVVSGILYKNFDIKAGVVVKATFKDSTGAHKEATATATASKNGQNLLLFLKTKPTGVTEPAPEQKITAFLYAGVNAEGLHDTYTDTGSGWAVYWTQSQPKQSNYAYGKDFHPDKKKIISASGGLKLRHYAIATKTLPDKLSVRVIDIKGEGIVNWPIRWTWEIDLQFCIRKDIVDSFIDESVGISSASVAAAWTKQSGTKMNGYLDQKITLVKGTLKITDLFFTVTVGPMKGSDGKTIPFLRKKMAFHDLPKGALLTFTCKTNKGRESGSKHFGTVNFTFRKS